MANNLPNVCVCVCWLEMIEKTVKSVEKLGWAGVEKPRRVALLETFNCFASTFAAHVVNRIFQFENAVNC